ncbi:phytanoyl-CoA dioxygenase family protein [Kitasatospora purpeofusca]|uniref:phytanoyl-CoA dioxygenase family protein n=1 Tax=Kitasatospora purpeofusca TaxID=67352 RepID=UPI0032473630
MQRTTAHPGLTAEQLYLFDTVGLLRFPGFLAEAEVAEARTLLPQLTEAPCELPAMRRWERLTHQSAFFRGMADSPRMIAKVRQVVNQPLRLIESYGTERAAGSELLMHGGSAESMDLAWGGHATKDVSTSHSYKDGRIYCLYVKALVYLDDINDEQDGVFTWLAGSHKANFPLLRTWHGENPGKRLAESDFPSLCRQPVRAGDMVLINESLLHGTTRKVTSGPRRFVAFSYAPSFMADWREISSTADLDIHDSGYADSDVEENLLAEA